MSAASALARGRVAAEALMVDTCTVTYVIGTHTDDFTGQVTEQRATRYTGRCKVQQPRASGTRVDAGAVTVTLVRLELHLPIAGTEVVARGDQVVITAAASDPALVGRTFRVAAEAHKSLATARRLSIEEVT